MGLRACSEASPDPSLRPRWGRGLGSASRPLFTPGVPERVPPGRASLIRYNEACFRPPLLGGVLVCPILRDARVRLLFQGYRVEFSLRGDARNAFLVVLLWFLLFSKAAIWLVFLSFF